MKILKVTSGSFFDQPEDASADLDVALGAAQEAGDNEFAAGIERLIRRFEQE